MKITIFKIKYKLLYLTSSRVNRLVRVKGEDPSTKISERGFRQQEVYSEHIQTKLL